ncbi:Hypothetical protein A7982_11445 [Minicystis rosea]|nr:Hypothetical protein A7982_11445 [Minicystis rosea]
MPEETPKSHERPPRGRRPILSKGFSRVSLAAHPRPAW